MANARGVRTAVTGDEAARGALLRDGWRAQCDDPIRLRPPPACAASGDYASRPHLRVISSGTTDW